MRHSFQAGSTAAVCAACQIIRDIGARGTDAKHFPCSGDLSQRMLPVCQAAVSGIAAKRLPCPGLKLLPGCRKKALSRAAAIPVLVSRLDAGEPETCWHAVAALRHMSTLPDIRVSPVIGEPERAGMHRVCST